MRASSSIIALILCTGLALLLVGCGSSNGSQSADNYPEQPVELIVPYGAGGATDGVARAFASAVEPYLDQPVTVVNRPGGGGAIAATEAANAEPDGYTALLASGGVLASTPALQEVEYSIDDFRGVSGLASQPYVFATSADSQWQTLEELANANERIEYSVAGVGNNTHIPSANFFREADVTAEAIPVDAASSQIQEVIGSRTQAASVNSIVAMPQVEAGEARPLAVTSSERLDYLPEVPTFEEQGYSGSTAYARWGLTVPAETSDERVAVLQEAARSAIESEEFQNSLQENYLLPADIQDGERWLNELMRNEVDKAREDVERLNIEGSGE